MMDTIFCDLILTNEVIVYMDDILIATSNDQHHHCEIAHQVLYQLEADLKNMIFISNPKNAPSKSKKWNT